MTADNEPRFDIDTLREPAEQAAFVAGLKERFRRKCNFMKLLEQDQESLEPNQVLE